MILEEHQSCSELLVVGSLLYFTYKVNFTQIPMYSKHRLHRIWHDDSGISYRSQNASCAHRDTTDHLEQMWYLLVLINFSDIFVTVFLIFFTFYRLPKIKCFYLDSPQVKHVYHMHKILRFPFNYQTLTNYSF